MTACWRCDSSMQDPRDHAPTAMVTSDELALPVTLAISGRSATLSTSTATKATCDLATTVRGAWGLAAAGDNAQIDVGPVTVTRTR